MTWEKMPIKAVCRGIYDGPHATPPVSDSGAVFLGIPNFKNGKLDLSEIRYISEKDYPVWTRRVTPQANDIVFSYEATLNLYAIIPEGFRGCLGRRMALIRVDESKVDYKFLYYYFFSAKWRSVIQQNTVLGATVDRIPLVKFPDFEIELPPMPVQKKIADILSAYDDLIENNQKQIKLLEEAAQRLYKEWFIDLRFPGHESTPIVNGLPEGWQKKKTSEVCDTVGGGTPSTAKSEYFENGTIKWVTPTDLTKKNSLILLDTEKKITQAGLDNSSAKLLPPETILMTSRASIGYFAVCEYEVCTNQGFIACIPKEEDMRFYLLFNLMSRTDEIKGKATGSTFLEITKRAFRNMSIIAPEKHIMSVFDKYVSYNVSRMRVLEKENARLIMVRDRLLSKLMSGNLEVSK